MVLRGPLLERSCVHLLLCPGLFPSIKDELLVDR